MNSFQGNICYRRKLKDSYQVIDIKGESLLLDELEMLQRNSVGALLAMEFMVADGESQLWYPITGLQSITNMCKMGRFKAEQLQIFLQSLADVCQSIEEYLLREQGVILEQSYFSEADRQVYFTYYPAAYLNREWGQISLKGSLMTFLEELVKTADYSDGNYVAYLFSVYEELSMENSSIEQISHLSVLKQSETSDEEVSLMNLSPEPESVKNPQKLNPQQLMETTQDHKIHNSEKKYSMIRHKTKKMIEDHVLDTKWNMKKKFRQYRDFHTEKWEDAPELITPEPRENLEHPTEMLIDQGEHLRQDDIGVLKYKEGTGQKMPILKNQVVLGKKKDCADFVVEDASVSRMHAMIAREEGGYYLEDLNSLNGTFLNGVQLEYKERVHLQHNDEISIGHTKLIFLQDGICPEEGPT